MEAICRFLISYEESISRPIRQFINYDESF